MVPITAFIVATLASLSDTVVKDADGLLRQAGGRGGVAPRDTLLAGTGLAPRAGGPPGPLARTR
jgi:hypothetical protein